MRRLFARLPWLVAIALPLGVMHANANAGTEFAGSGQGVGLAGTEVEIPEEGDWTDQGVIIDPGSGSAWDVRLDGAISPTFVTKFGSTYHLYYVGSDGDRADGGPAHRALGLATSTDGLNWSKFGQNPVLTWQPNPSGCNEDEEGIFSASGVIGGAGNLQLHYGAITQTGCSTVSVAGRRAVSSDGKNFTDKHEILSPTNQQVWGNEGGGDELGPVGAYRNDADEWFMYYFTKNFQSASNQWSLGLAKGTWCCFQAADTEKYILRTDFNPDLGLMINASPAKISSTEVAVFTTQFDNGATVLDVWKQDIDSPAPAGSPVESYGFFDDSQYVVSVYLDEAEETWFMFYLDNDDTETSISLKTAPVTYGGGGGGGLVSDLSVEDTANAADWSIQADLQEGSTQYGDRAFELTDVPAEVTDADWIRTANDSKAFTGSPVATFTVTDDAVVYVAHDDRVSPKPSWLSSWTDTGLDLVNDEPTPVTFSLFSRAFSGQSTVELGPQGVTSFSMYTVVVTPD